MRYVIAVLSAMLWPLASSAATITLAFSGGIGVGGGAPFSFSAGGYSSLVSISSPVHGTITFGTTGTDSDPNPRVGSYLLSAPNFAMDIWLGNLHLTRFQGIVTITDNVFVDRFSVFAETATPGGGTNLGFSISDSNMSVFANDSLPAVFPPISSWAPPLGMVFFGRGEFSDTFGAFMPFYADSVAVVPEPTVAWTICAALAAVALGRRSSRS